MKEYLHQIRTHIFYAAFFSLFINLLQLTFSIYMLAIYDRVLPSYSMPTLTTLTVMALFALTVFGLLFFLRSRILIHAANWLENRLNDKLLKSMIEDASSLQKIGAQSALADLNTVKSYLSGAPVMALFDIPWTPLLLFILYLLHPMIGLTATAGAIGIVILSILQEVLTKKRINEANNISGEGRQFIASSLRNAEIINSLGMTDNIVNRWDKGQSTVQQMQTQASRQAGSLQAVIRSLRMSMQVIIYAVGAYLTLKNESTAGIMITASIIMGRALAPIEQMMSTWRQTIEVRSAHKRLRSLIDKIKEKEETTDLPAPTGKFDVETVSLGFGDRAVLRGVSFSLNKGEIMALIGPSASGKTCLCRIVLGIWPAMGGGGRSDWMAPTSINGVRKNLDLISDTFRRTLSFFPEPLRKISPEWGMWIPRRW